jgi:DNA-binding CsgD family transcriptional regulator
VPGIVSFSDTQLAIIRMICNQLTSKEISKKLKLTKRTVEDYRGIIQDKMGVLNVAGLVVYAIKHGIYEVE